MSRKIFLSLFSASAFIYTVIYSFNSCKNSTEKKEGTQKISFTAKDGFVGDVACGNCHQKEFADWKTSDHYWAMLPPNDSTVIGNFNNVTYTADGVTSHFFKRQEKFFVNTQGPDGKNHDYEIKYTFGVRPLQQYLVEFPGGRMQALRQCWNVKEKKWFHQYPNQNVYHGDWLHWSHAAQNWNAMCSECHSTNLQRNFNAEADTFNTTWSVLNVSCEACHGQGEKHVQYVSADDYSTKEKVAGSYLLLHKDQSSKDQITTCAPCHSRRLVVDSKPFQSLQLLDHYIPEVPHTPMYHADGQFNDEDYEYASFSQSRMFQKNVKCSDCHNPHSGKILFIGNALCLQCHEKKLDDPAHTFHAMNTEGSQCINCHMPSKNFMVIDQRRDHSFRIPRPDQSVKYGTPNACNNCHADKNAKWAADAIVKWFGPVRKYHYSDDLIPGSMGTATSAAALQKLCLPDTNVPPIIHATALNYMSFSYDEKNIPLLLDALQNPNSLIRYEALRSLRFYPQEKWQAAATPLLNDPVKGVRIAGVDLFLEIQNQLDVNAQQSFAVAKKEFDIFLHFQSDEPAGRILSADVNSRLKNYTAAEKDYLAALRMDSLLLQARINLSTMYDIVGKKEEALQQLLTASKIEPNNERVNYYLALLYFEMNDKENAAKYFAKSAAVSKNTRVFYNFGLLLEQLKRDGEAEKIYKRGIEINPDDQDLNYVLALFYYNRKRSKEAAPYAIKLMQMMPQDPSYQQLYNQLAPK